MATLSKQAKRAVQLHRLSKKTPKGEATVGTHVKFNHEKAAEMTASVHRDE